MLPIEQVRGESEARNEEDKPMMLLALNADNSVRWDEMEQKVSLHRPKLSAVLCSPPLIIRRDTWHIIWKSPSLSSGVN